MLPNVLGQLALVLTKAPELTEQGVDAALEAGRVDAPQCGVYLGPSLLAEGAALEEPLVGRARHPMALAQQALTASAATNGRFTLGIGLSHKVVIENMLGLDYSKPVRHMREYLSVLTPLLSGDQVMYRGEEYRVTARVAVPDAPKPPVIVAALGPQMLRLAGKMADGTATWMGGPRYLRETAIPAIRAAAAEAGRPAPRIVSGFPIAVTSRVDDAKEAAAKVFANYGALPSYRAVLDVEGAPGPADIAIIGSEVEVEAQVRQLAADGVTDFNASVLPVAGDAAASERTYELLAGLAKAGV